MDKIFIELTFSIQMEGSHFYKTSSNLEMYMGVPHNGQDIYWTYFFNTDGRITLLENFIHIPTKYQQKDHMSVNSTYMTFSVTFSFKLLLKTCVICSFNVHRNITLLLLIEII